MLANKYFRFGTMLGASVLLVSCASQSVREELKAHPELVFDLIRDNPEKFLEVATKAYDTARVAQEAEARKQETAAKEAEFNNPLKPEISSGRAIRGSLNAPVMIVAYSDFQCPFCKKGKDTLEAIMAKYGDKVAVLHKHLPLEFHPMAKVTAQYFEAIALQDKALAYKFHDAVYDNQGELGTEKQKYLDKLAKGLNLNMAKLKKDLGSKKVDDTIKADMAEAGKFGIAGTPVFLVGGVKISGAQPNEVFEAIIDRRLKDSVADKQPNKG